MRKIFAFDMDGTILNDQDSLPLATIEALASLKAAGHIPVIATGRPIDDVKRSLQKHVHLFEDIVCNNGAYLVNLPQASITRSDPIDWDVISAGLRIGQEHNCFMVIYGDSFAQRAFLGKNLNIDWESPDFREFKKFRDQLLSPAEVLAWAKTQHVSQFSLRASAKTITKVKSLFTQFQHKTDLHIANSVYLDINPKGASKWSGITTIAAKLDIQPHNIVAFGDSGNDLQMLKNAGWGICMSNGSADAKAIANEVIGDNNSDAIAQKIKAIIEQ